MLPALDGPGNAADDFELTNDGWLFYGAVFTGQDLSGNPSQNEDSLFHYGSYGLHMGLGGAPNSQGTLPFSGVAAYTVANRQALLQKQAESAAVAQRLYTDEKREPYEPSAAKQWQNLKYWVKRFGDGRLNPNSLPSQLNRT